MWLVGRHILFVSTHPPDQLIQLVHLEDVQVAESFWQIFSRAVTASSILDELQLLGLRLVSRAFAFHLGWFQVYHCHL